MNRVIVSRYASEINDVVVCKGLKSRIAYLGAIAMPTSKEYLKQCLLCQWPDPGTPSYLGAIMALLCSPVPLSGIPLEYPISGLSLDQPATAREYIPVTEKAQIQAGS